MKDTAAEVKNLANLSLPLRIFARIVFTFWAKNGISPVSICGAVNNTLNSSSDLTKR